VELQNRERPVPGFATLVGGSVILDSALSDADCFDPDRTGSLTLRVFHTPGHSPGSICLFLKGEGILFSGDVVPVKGDLPVYDDAVASVGSIRRIREIGGIRVLYSAWDEPRTWGDVRRQIDSGLEYLQEIHRVVLASADAGSADLTDITRTVVATLGLPPQAVNPLLERTFRANLEVRDRNSLTE
jgi:hydroxyacylglutathione hydrolase